ncbi:hypothetical protein L0F63_005916 [Massospora cicadina]|nr:hypothetical protein L0F63_005916 [Massospora cicadina]
MGKKFYHLLNQGINDTNPLTKLPSVILGDEKALALSPGALQEQHPFQTKRGPKAQVDPLSQLSDLAHMVDERWGKFTKILKLPAQVLEPSLQILG